MKKDEKALVIAASLMAAAGIIDAAISVRDAIRARRERKKAEKEFEETVKIAEQNLKDLKDLNAKLKAEEERKQIEAIQYLKEKFERQKREAEESGQDIGVQTRKLINRANNFMEKYENRGDDDEVPE